MLDAAKVSHDIFEVASEGEYQRTAPYYTNINLVETKFQDKYLGIWRGSRARYPALKLYLLQQVRMEDVGYLFVGSELILESVLHLGAVEIERISEKYSTCDHSEDQPQNSETAVSLILKRRSSSNYGHWLVEFFPWPGLIEEASVSYDLIVLDYFARNMIGSIQDATLSLYSVPSPRIQRYGRESRYLSNVLVPSKSCIHNHTKHPKLIEVARRVGLTALRYLKPESDIKSTPLIYLIRKVPQHGV